MNDCVCLLQIVNGWKFFFFPLIIFCAKVMSSIITARPDLSMLRLNCLGDVCERISSFRCSIVLFQLTGFWMGHLSHPNVDSTNAYPISIRIFYHKIHRDKTNKCRNEIRLNSSRILNLLSKFSVSKPQFETLFLWPYCRKKKLFSLHIINTYFKLNYIQCGFHGILLGIWNLTNH